MRVLETLRGPALPNEIVVRADARVLLEGGGSLAPGATCLLLVARDGDQFRVPAGLRQTVVPVERVAERDAARTLLRGYAAGGAELDALLRNSVMLAIPRLRAGVLEDLSRRLGPDDAAFLMRLAQQRTAPEDVRVFAIRSLGGLAAPPPAALADLLRPTESVEIRTAVLAAYATHGSRDVLQRGLEDPDEQVRQAAVDELASPEDAALLERHFARESALRVKLAVVRQLGLIGTDASRAALQRIAVNTRDPAIRGAAEPWLGAPPDR